MKIYQQLFLILLFSLVGEGISLVLPFPIPGSIIGMLALFAALQIGWIKLEQVEKAGGFLTDNLAILFLPAGVGVMVYFPVIAQNWLSLSVVTVVSTVFTLGFTAWLVQRLVGVFNVSKDHPNAAEVDDAQ